VVLFGTAGNKFKDEDAIFALSQELGKKYDKSVQIVFANKNFDKLDRKFVETVLKEGIILYGNLPFIKAEKLLLEPYSILNFELNKIGKNTRNTLTNLKYTKVHQKV